MIASAIDLVVSILWLASAIAVLSAVILMALVPAYGFWIESKTGMDVEGYLYTILTEAIDEAEEVGGSIEVRVVTEASKASTEGKPDVQG